MNPYIYVIMPMGQSSAHNLPMLQSLYHPDIQWWCQCTLCILIGLHSYIYLLIYSCLYIANMHYVKIWNQTYLIIMILDYKQAVMSIVWKWWCFGLRCSSGVDVAACRLDLLQPIGQKPEIKLPCSTFLLHSAPRTAAPAFHLRPSFTHCQASQRACQGPWDHMCLESQSLRLRH